MSNRLSHIESDQDDTVTPLLTTDIGPLSTQAASINTAQNRLPSQSSSTPTVSAMKPSYDDHHRIDLSFSLQHQSLLAAITPEILANIFSYLPLTEILLLASVCRDFRRVINNPSLYSVLDLTSIAHIITDESLVHFLSHPRFQRVKALNLAGCTALTDTSLLEITKLLPHLHTLDISSCIHASPDTIVKIGLKRSLKRFDFYNSVGQPLVVPIVEAILAYRRQLYFQPPKNRQDGEDAPATSVRQQHQQPNKDYPMARSEPFSPLGITKSFEMPVPLPVSESAHLHDPDHENDQDESHDLIAQHHVSASSHVPLVTRFLYDHQLSVYTRRVMDNGKVEYIANPSRFIDEYNRLYHLQKNQHQQPYGIVPATTGGMTSGATPDPSGDGTIQLHGKYAVWKTPMISDDSIDLGKAWLIYCAQRRVNPQNLLNTNDFYYSNNRYRQTANPHAVGGMAPDRDQDGDEESSSEPDEDDPDQPRDIQDDDGDDGLLGVIPDEENDDEDDGNDDMDDMENDADGANDGDVDDGDDNWPDDQNQAQQQQQQQQQRRRQNERRRRNRAPRWLTTFRMQCSSSHIGACFGTMKYVPIYTFSPTMTTRQGPLSLAPYGEWFTLSPPQRPTMTNMATGQGTAPPPPLVSPSSTTTTTTTTNNTSPATPSPSGARTRSDPTPVKGLVLYPFAPMRVYVFGLYCECAAHQGSIAAIDGYSRCMLCQHIFIDEDMVDDTFCLACATNNMKTISLWPLSIPTVPPVHSHHPVLLRHMTLVGIIDSSMDISSIVDLEEFVEDATRENESDPLLAPASPGSEGGGLTGHRLLQFVQQQLGAQQRGNATGNRQNPDNRTQSGRIIPRNRQVESTQDSNTQAQDTLFIQRPRDGNRGGFATTDTADGDVDPIQRILYDPSALDDTQTSSMYRHGLFQHDDEKSSQDSDEMKSTQFVPYGEESSPAIELMSLKSSHGLRDGMDDDNDESLSLNQPHQQSSTSNVEMTSYSVSAPLSQLLALCTQSAHTRQLAEILRNASSLGYERCVITTQPTYQRRKHIHAICREKYGSEAIFHAAERRRQRLLNRNRNPDGNNLPNVQAQEDDNDDDINALAAQRHESGDRFSRLFHRSCGQVDEPYVPAYINNQFADNEFNCENTYQPSSEGGLSSSTSLQRQQQLQYQQGDEADDSDAQNRDKLYVYADCLGVKTTEQEQNLGLHLYTIQHATSIFLPYIISILLTIFLYNCYLLYLDLPSESLVRASPMYYIRTSSSDDFAIIIVIVIIAAFVVMILFASRFTHFCLRIYRKLMPVHFGLLIFGITFACLLVVTMGLQLNLDYITLFFGMLMVGIFQLMGLFYPTFLMRQLAMLLMSSCAATTFLIAFPEILLLVLFGIVVYIDLMDSAAWNHFPPITVDRPLLFLGAPILPPLTYPLTAKTVLRSPELMLTSLLVGLCFKVDLFTFFLGLIVTLGSIALSVYVFPLKGRFIRALVISGLITIIICIDGLIDNGLHQFASTLSSSITQVEPIFLF